ncbi:MAG: radical SAM protein [Thermoanaerobaculia bacterium]
MGTPSSSFSDRAFALAQPLTASLELTYRCNWRCVFCYNPRHSDVRRLERDEWMTVLDDLRELGTLTVTLTGGEALASPDFLSVAKAVRERAFALRVFTNGSLVDAETAKEIAALQPAAVEISMHGATRDVHDRTTGLPGSFDAMLSGLTRLRDEGVRVLLKTPVTNLNEHQIDQMLDLAASLGVKYRMDATITPRDDGDRGPLVYTASRDAMRRVAEIGLESNTLGFIERPEKAANCGLGRITMAVDPEGNVFPCIQWRHTSLGNVREIRLRELWRTSQVRRDAATVADDANGRMRTMEPPYSIYSYCPALAAEATGDPLNPDPAFLTRAEIAWEVAEERRRKERASA